MSTRQIVNLIQNMTKNMVLKKLAIAESAIAVNTIKCKKFGFTGGDNEVEGFENDCKYGPSSYNSGLRKYSPKGYEQGKSKYTGNYERDNRHDYGPKYGNY